MSWIIYALGAIATQAGSDIFRKLASSLKDPFFLNLVFQSGAFFMAIILYMMFSRKSFVNTQEITYAFIGGLLISVFTTLFFKAITLGPGIATVSPGVRIGAVALVALAGVFIFREKLTWNLIAGITLASTGVYLLFLNK